MTASGGFNQHHIRLVVIKQVVNCEIHLFEACGAADAVCGDTYEIIVFCIYNICVGDQHAVHIQFAHVIDYDRD